MVRTYIRKKIPLESRYLDSNIIENLLTKINRTMLGKCYKDHGYILHIYGIKSVKDNYISSAQSTSIFDVIFSVETLHPKKDLEISGKVIQLFSAGLIIKVKNVLKVFVGLANLQENGYKFDGSRNVFFNEDDIISTDNEINLKISVVRFENNEFKCIGLLNKKNVE